MPFDNLIPLSFEKRIDILLVGELLVDIITDSVSNQVHKMFGGSPANIALNLKRLGSIAKLYSAVGNDSNGTFLLNKINDLDINSTISVHNTKTTTVSINKSTSTPIPLFDRNSDFLIEFTNDLKLDIIDSKILHFSYWPISLEPARSTIIESIKIAKSNNTIIGFDPNYHPLIDDNNLQGLSSLKEIIQYVDIIKPSLDDSIRIFGDNHSLEEYLQMYQDLGCKLVIMTLGEKGLIAKYKNESIVLPSYAKEVIDSTGAGDAFWSGLYSGLTNQLSIYKSIQLGLLCSAYNLKVIGADAHLPEFSHIMKELESR